MTYAITLGGFTTEHLPIITDAPVDYDGFGTFTVEAYDRPLADNEGTYTGGNARLILVPKEHARWQEARNASGLHCFVAAEGFGVDEEHITAKLNERLRAVPLQSARGCP